MFEQQNKADFINFGIFFFYFYEIQLLKNKKVTHLIYFVQQKKSILHHQDL